MPPGPLADSWPKATPRIIYLNGEDTGLSALSRDMAITTLSRVMQRRGHLSATPAALARTYSAAVGRVDFTWPPAPGTRP